MMENFVTTALRLILLIQIALLIFGLPWLAHLFERGYEKVIALPIVQRMYKAANAGKKPGSDRWGWLKRGQYLLVLLFTTALACFVNFDALSILKELIPALSIPPGAGAIITGIVWGLLAMREHDIEKAKAAKRI